MTCAYVVQRGAFFHFRIRVPADLVSAFGHREVQMSLGENRQRQAALRASHLVLHAQSFFRTIRVFMKHLACATTRMRAAMSDLVRNAYVLAEPA